MNDKSVWVTFNSETDIKTSFLQTYKKHLSCLLAIIVCSGLALIIFFFSGTFSKENETETFSVQPEFIFSPIDVGGLPEIQITPHHDFFIATLSEIPAAKSLSPKYFIVETRAEPKSLKTYGSEMNKPIVDGWVEHGKFAYRDVFQYNISFLDSNTALTIRYRLKLKGSQEVTPSMPQVVEPLPKLPPGKPKVYVRRLDDHFFGNMRVTQMEAWPSASYDGGSPITKYQYKIFYEGASSSGEREVLDLKNAEALKLVNGESPFKIAFRAINNVGVGEFSAWKKIDLLKMDLYKPKIQNMKVASIRGNVIAVSWELDPFYPGVYEISISQDTRPTDAFDATVKSSETYYEYLGSLGMGYSVTVQIKNKPQTTVKKHIQLPKFCLPDPPVFVQSHDRFSNGLSFKWYNNRAPLCKSTVIQWIVLNNDNPSSVLCQSSDSRSTWCDTHGEAFQPGQVFNISVAACGESGCSDIKPENTYIFKTASKSGACSNRENVRYWRSVELSDGQYLYNGQSFVVKVDQCTQQSDTKAKFESCLNAYFKNKLSTPFNLDPISPLCFDCFSDRFKCMKLCLRDLKNYADCCTDCKRLFNDCSGVEEGNAPPDVFPLE